MDEKLQELLDKTYELEGLVHLAIKRADDINDFSRLIQKKSREVSELCASLVTENNKTEEIETSHDVHDADVKSSPDNFSYSLDEYSLDDAPGDEDMIIVDRAEDRVDDKDEDAKEIAAVMGLEPGKQKGKLVFSINERFRFRKELFDNSDADFNNTMALVASMEDYDEAEDFFINEEGLDKNNPVVMEFLEIIKRYFK